MLCSVQEYALILVNLQQVSLAIDVSVVGSRATYRSLL